MSALKSFFDELRVVERTPVIELKSIYGLSALRDLTIGTVTSDGKEFALSSAGGVDRAVLDTAERGPYAPGQELEPGAAIRIPERLTAGQINRVGYYDDDDGWFYEYNEDGLYLVIRKGGAESSRQLWGRWDEDGVIQKGNLITQSLRPGDGHVHQIALTWYGFGPAEYSFQLPAPSARGWMEKLGFIRPRGGTSTDNPHLPLRAEVVTEAGAAPCTMYVSGRQVNMVGKYDPIWRPTSVEMSSTTVDSTSWTALGAVRRRAVTPYALTKLEAMSIIADADVRIMIALNPDIPNAAGWSGGIPDIPITETLLELNPDPGAVDVTTAAWVQKDLIQASSQGNKTGGRPASFVRTPMIEQQPFVVLAQAVTGTGVSVRVMSKFQEDY